MRIWSLHPKHLDAKGLVAVWRETLLAKHVLEGKTKGYKNHPQLDRFKKHPEPLAAISTYLEHVHKEATARGYNFSQEKIGTQRTTTRIPVTTGQHAFEHEHLQKKLFSRSPQETYRIEKTLHLHPLFFSIKGDIAELERV